MYHLYVPGVAEYPAISRQYRAWGEKVKCGKRDRVYALVADGDLVGAARVLEPEAAVFLLRNLTVDPERRRRGIARELMTQMLARPELESLYCYALAHLTPFYRSLGFVTRAAEQVPESIAEPYRRYTQRGKNFILMAANREEREHV